MDWTPQDESARLLFDDPHGTHYGSFGEQGHGIVPADPQEVQRESEALQKVVVQTSKYGFSCRCSLHQTFSGPLHIAIEYTDAFSCSHLVDVFAMMSHQSQPTQLSLLPVHDARFFRYQGVLARMTAHDQLSQTIHHTNDSTPSASGNWVGEDDSKEMKSWGPVKTDGIGPLLGGFADADCAIEWTWNGSHHYHIMSYGVLALITVTIPFQWWAENWHGMVHCGQVDIQIWLDQLSVIEVCVVSFYYSLCQKRLFTGC